MTGREKLIEWAKNATVEELSGVFGCPQCFELKPLEPHDCVRFDTNCCDCWKQALEREYEEEEK